MKRKYLVLTMLIVLMSLTQCILAKGITMTFNGQVVTASTAPVQENGVVLVPLRMISEQLGAKVAYDAPTKHINITQGTVHIQLEMKESPAPGEAKIVNGVTMVPVRFVSEQLGAKIIWDAKSQTVAITYQVRQYPIARIILKDYGTIEAALYQEYAPQTVENFIKLANSHFYDGLSLHRIVKDFVVQGGCPEGNGTGGPGYSIVGEFAANGYTGSSIRHTKGVLSMARSQSPNSAGSQFFIVTEDAPHLDGYYAAFGKVTKGIEIVEVLNSVAVDRMDKPLQPIVIESIRVE
ncbi:MAG: peptidylprolyl isomerase [Cellulosilyticaceae bacterium]